MSVAPTVFIIDDDNAIRDALALLMKQVGLRTECYANAQAFLDALQPSQYGCLIVDVRMPGMSGLDLQHHLVDLGIGIPVIVLTAHADVPMAVRAMKLGAVDFFEKPYNDQALLDCVQICIESAVRSEREREQRAALRARLNQLSRRERQVMDLIVSGKYSKAISAQLGISPKTVDVHRAHVLEKMGVKSVAELVRVAMMIGVVDG